MPSCGEAFFEPKTFELLSSVSGASTVAKIDYWQDTNEMDLHAAYVLNMSELSASHCWSQGPNLFFFVARKSIFKSLDYINECLFLQTYALYSNIILYGLVVDARPLVTILWFSFKGRFAGFKYWELTLNRKLYFDSWIHELGSSLECDGCAELRKRVEGLAVKVYIGLCVPESCTETEIREDVSAGSLDDILPSFCTFWHLFQALRVHRV